MADRELDVLLLAGRLELRGSTANTLQLVEHLGDRRVNARVACADAAGVAVSRPGAVTEYAHLDTPLIGRLVRERLRRDLVEQVPDLIHAQSAAQLRLGAWLAGRFDRPLVVTAHEPLRGLWRRLPGGEPIRVIAVSSEIVDDLVSSRRVPARLISVIPAGVDVPARSAARRVLDPDHLPVVGTAGPLEAVEGLPYFIGAAQKVLATGRDVEFLVAGPGPEESNLRRLARELDIATHITFVPNLPDVDWSLDALDIFCAPSLQHGLGTIMLEAMARGRPVIATGVGGIYSAIRDDRTGLVVPPRDSHVLAERILELLDDPARARALGDQASQLVRDEFGVERMVDRTVEVYHEIVAEAAGRG